MRRRLPPPNTLQGSRSRFPRMPTRHASEDDPDYCGTAKLTLDTSATPTTARGTCDTVHGAAVPRRVDLCGGESRNRFYNIRPFIKGRVRTPDILPHRGIGARRR